MAAVNVKPLGDRVLVQPLEEQETKKGGIIIPDTAKEKPQEGKVVALGTGNARGLAGGAMSGLMRRISNSLSEAPDACEISPHTWLSSPSAPAANAAYS